MGLLASPPAFKGAGSGIVDSCGPGATIRPWLQVPRGLGRGRRACGRIRQRTWQGRPLPSAWAGAAVFVHHGRRLGSGFHRGRGCGKENAMTTRRTLTITMSPDWRAALRQADEAAQADSYQGETLNFESPGAFFGKLTERRWALVTALLRQGAMAVRELARARRPRRQARARRCSGAGRTGLGRTRCCGWRAVSVCRRAHRHACPSCKRRVMNRHPGWAAQWRQADLCQCWHSA